MHVFSLLLRGRGLPRGVGREEAEEKVEDEYRMNEEVEEDRYFLLFQDGQTSNLLSSGT